MKKCLKFKVPKVLSELKFKKRIKSFTLGILGTFNFRHFISL